MEMTYRKLFLLFFIEISFTACAQHSADSNNSSLPRRITFKPETFSNSFSANISPVLRINSGDTIFTETIDASGHDKLGVKRQKGGNPLTGPFYINGSTAWDILKITLYKVSLNRSDAFTTESFSSRSMPDSISKQFKRPQLVKWRLDSKEGVAYPDSSYISSHTNLAGYKVPLHPFLGCIGVAPDNNKKEILSFFQGNFGGNLDFSGMTEGSTIYLPVFHEGGFFYVGDGHAVQGDGEIAGNALETSLDVEFSVELIKGGGSNLNSPRVENSQYRMILGTAKTLDEAIKNATYGLMAWLQEDFHLSTQECTQILSTSIEYRVAEIADPEVVMVAKIKKELLKQSAKRH
jgi:acetamidase/formamidase